MSTSLKSKSSVRTTVRISLRWKILIGVGLFIFITGIVIILVQNLGVSLQSSADNDPIDGPASNNVYFDASPESYIEFGNGTQLPCINSLPLRNRLTITLWVKWDDLSAPGVGPHANLFTLNDSVGCGDSGVFWIQHNAANSHFEFALNTADNGRSVLQSSTTPVEDTWYHIACVYNGVANERKMHIYINGVLEGTLNEISGKIAEISPLARMNMGRWCNPQENYRHFNGCMDEVSIWSTALTATEINDIMGNPTTITGVNYDAPGLIGYWSFDDHTAASSGSCSNMGIIGQGATLPVDLVSFEGDKSGKYALLHWLTASEANNHYFSIERSIDLVEYKSVGIIMGAGNSNNNIYYSFTDEHPEPGMNYYRLRQVDFDGSNKCSQIIAIDMGEMQGGIGELKIGPNPFSGFLNIKYTAAYPGMADLCLYDFMGNLVQRIPTTVNEGVNEIQMHIDNHLPSGTYLACVAQGEHMSSKIKLIRTR